MKKMCFLLFLSGMSLILAAPPWAGAVTPAECPSCEDFGMQLFPAKKEAPPFTLKSLDGTQVTLDQLKGKPLLLFFWGTWCESCKDEMGPFQKFTEGKRDLITIYTVVVDGEREKRARQILEKLKVNLPTLLIYKEKVIDTYEIRMIPTTYVIDSNGFLLGKGVGPRDWSKPQAWSAIKELVGIH